MRRFTVTYTVETDDTGFVQDEPGGDWEAVSVPGKYEEFYAPSDATITELKRPFQPGYYRMVPDTEFSAPPVAWYNEPPKARADGLEYERVEIISKGVI